MSSRTLLWLLLLLVVPVSAAGELDPQTLFQLDQAVFRARPMAMLPVDNLSGVVVVYGDRYAIVWVVRLSERGAQVLWRSSALEGGPIQDILVEDLDGRGGHDIIVRTQGGQAFVFDDTYSSRWSSVNEDFRAVNAMAIAQLDADPAFEILMVADNQVLCYDGDQFVREQQFPQVYANVIEVAVGNVDTDRELEIVLNSGRVLDALTADAEWETQPFGVQISLIDIDGDGIQEVIGYGQPNQGTIRIFDVDERQEKPFQ
jgi:hypothetical protein